MPKHRGSIREHVMADADKPVSIIPPQEMEYYEGQSPDFAIQHVPESAHRVLDVGCGRGWLGRELKQRGVQEVVGIEHFADAAEEARTYLDTVFCADIDAVAFDYPDGYFDCIVYSGVLEHLRDPYYTLFEHRRMLADDGSMVALLPNITHWTVMLDLLQDRFRYQSAGQLDATHYRFFTRHEIARMCQATGFTLDKLVGHKLVEATPNVATLKNALSTTGLAADEFLEDLDVYIWTLRADKIAGWTPQPRVAVQPTMSAHEADRLEAQALAKLRSADAPLEIIERAEAEPAVGIVIVTHNAKADLEACLQAIEKQSHLSNDIVVVDNASSDGTREWLADRHDVRMIYNESNRGYAAAANQGIAEARGAHLLFVHPDTRVTDGWDAKLVAAASGDNVGAVGPVSNAVYQPQDVRMYMKESLAGQQQVDDVARMFASWYPNQGTDVRCLHGCCLCVPRATFDRVGVFDETLFVGGEEVEFSLRLQEAGMTQRVALDTFVLHAGGNSLNALPVEERERILQESTDAVYAKLVARYGAGKVPTWTELLGMPWRLPSEFTADEFTGERANPHSPNMLDDVMAEHWARYEFALQHAEARTVLDAACGTGYGSAKLGEVARDVRGYDIDAETVAYARTKTDLTNVRYEAADIRNLPEADDTFDLVTSFETIEHVEDGRGVLEEFVRVLKSDGMLLISTPLGSEDGNPYHLSHYNRADFVPLLQEYFGYVELKYQRGDQFYADPITPEVAPRFMGEYALAVCWAPRKARVGTPDVQGSSPTDAPLISIVIPAWNQIDYTRACIESIRQWTPESYEIIVVDNGSTDDTSEWLAQQPDVRTITNAENLGFAAAANQGLAAADGQYLILLNNDTEVMPEWATRMIAAATTNERVGLIGPMSNNVPAAQEDSSANAHTDDALVAYARERGAAFSNDVEDVPWLSGFCWLIPRDVYASVGALDERFGIGTFEDNDYCKRVAMHGKRLLVARDSFVHHVCSVSFKAAGIDYRSQCETNQQIYLDKWREDPLTRGAEMYGRSDLEAAAKSFRQAAEDAPEYADAYRNLAAVFIRCHRWGDALEPLETLCRIRPRWWSARLELAKTYLRCGRPIDASREAEFLLNYEHLEEGLRAGALVTAGEVAACADEWDTAEHAFRTALLAQGDAAGAWNGLGLVAHHHGSVDEARASFTKAMDLDTRAADPLSNLGVLEWQAGDPEAAVARLEAALDLDPLHADALENFVAIACANGRSDRAQNRLQMALQLDPSRSDARELLAQCEAV